MNVGEILPDSRFYLLRTRDNARHRRSIRYNRAIQTSVSDPDSFLAEYGSRDWMTKTMIPTTNYPTTPDIVSYPNLH